MKEADRKALVENKGWRDFRDWVKATIELENREVLDEKRLYNRDKYRGRRDAFEDVFDMMLAFEKKGWTKL